MRELHTARDVAAASDDALVRWGAQALLTGGRAWAHGDAVGVHAPDLNRHHRLLLAGPAPDVAVVLADRLHAHGPTLRPLVPSELSAGVRALLPDLVEFASFGWMERAGTLAAPDGVRWLAERELDDAEALLRKASPGTYVWPREPGSRRWAGMHVDGALVAVGGDAWTAEHVGFLAGVATHPDHRGRGLSTTLCRFVVHHLLEEHPACALMVDGGNHQAIKVYRRLGFRYRSVTILLPSNVAQSLPGRDSDQAG
jgi:ribosomal protein S18 acetylase RimI-like enzyme